MARYVRKRRRSGCKCGIRLTSSRSLLLQSAMKSTAKSDATRRFSRRAVACLRPARSLNTRWNALGGQAKDAYRTMDQMIDTPEYAVALLKERVQPVQHSDPDTVAKLIVQLDSKNFAEREKAQTALEKMGEGAAHLIVRALEG